MKSLLITTSGLVLIALFCWLLTSPDTTSGVEISKASVSNVSFSVEKVDDAGLFLPPGCGSYLGSSYYGTGFYFYPDQTLDLTCASGTITINWYVDAVPNRFTVYNSNGVLVGTSNWKGYANYPGPWGMSINTPNSGNFSFSKSTNTYTLRVETSTPSGTNDYWSVSVGCSC